MLYEANGILTFSASILRKFCLMTKKRLWLLKITVVSIYGHLCLYVVVVVALLFYVHGKHLRSCRDGQLT